MADSLSRPYRILRRMAPAPRAAGQRYGSLPGRSRCLPPVGMYCAAVKPDPSSGPTSSARNVVPAPVGGLVVLVLVLAAMLLLREVASLVVPLLFGAFLALIAWPLVGALRRRNVRHALALAVTILVVLVVVIGAATIVAVSVGELVVLIPRYEDRLA